MIDNGREEEEEDDWYLTLNHRLSTNRYQRQDLWLFSLFAENLTRTQACTRRSLYQFHNLDSPFRFDRLRFNRTHTIKKINKLIKRELGFVL